MVPLELPVKANEAASLADLIFQQVEGKPLTEESRSRLAGRVQSLQLESIIPYAGSLQRDPIHPSTYYIAVDTNGGAGVQAGLLLRIALASSPSSGLFPGAILIGRMRPGGGREIVVNAIPFASTDHDNIRTFAEQVDRAFLPRQQGAQPAIAVGNRHPEISLPAVFQAFRAILKSTGINFAPTTQLSAMREMTTVESLAARDGEDPLAPGHTRVSIEHLYHAGLWAAIRCGFRDGYTAEANHFMISGDSAGSMEAAKAAIREAAGFTKFTIDTSHLFDMRADRRHPEPWSEAAVRERFTSRFPAGEQSWIRSEFVKTVKTGDLAFELSEQDAMRLALKFGPSLKVSEELYDYIQLVKSGQSGWKQFDVEVSLFEAETLTTPEELFFFVQWLAARGRPAQLVAPNLGFEPRRPYPLTIDELRTRVTALAAVARLLNVILSFHSGSGKQEEVLSQIGRATGGRLNYKISGELQLQLFDVLSGQPAGSYWRSLYERMLARCERFAAAGAFGRVTGLDPAGHLGDSECGRVDGNPFLVRWLGNVVGSGDIDSPDGDRRFFKEKLDELPPDMLKEVRQRNSRYIVWLANHLRG